MGGKLPRTINVSFTYETKLSGIEDHSQHHYEQNADWLYSMYDNRTKLTDGDVWNSQILPFADGCKYEGQPIIMSEFGDTHYAQSEGWGYGAALHTMYVCITDFCRISIPMCTEHT